MSLTGTRVLAVLYFSGEEIRRQPHRTDRLSDWPPVTLGAVSRAPEAGTENKERALFHAFCSQDEIQILSLRFPGFEHAPISLVPCQFPWRHGTRAPQTWASCFSCKFRNLITQNPNGRDKILFGVGLSLRILKASVRLGVLCFSWKWLQLPCIYGIFEQKEAG